jgi:DNA-binding NarL/FixJ family response regulator
MPDSTGRRRPTRVLVAARHRAARVGAVRALGIAGFEVVGECATVADAAATARDRRPDVCVVDALLTGGGTTAAAALAAAAPAPRVVLIGTGSTAGDALAAFAAGASGYLLEDVTGERLALAVADVAAGHLAVAAELVAALVDVVRAVRGEAAPGGGLTQRERQVLGLLALEMPTKEVAQRLGLSPTTVRRHASAAVRKLGADDRDAAIAGLGRVHGCERP